MKLQFRFISAIYMPCRECKYNFVIPTRHGIASAICNRPAEPLISPLRCFKYKNGLIRL